MKLNSCNAFIVCTNIYEEWLSLCVLDWKYFVADPKRYYSMIILSTACFELPTNVTIKMVMKKKQKSAQEKGRDFESWNYPKGCLRVELPPFQTLSLFCARDTSLVHAFSCGLSLRGWLCFFMLYMMHILLQCIFFTLSSELKSIIWWLTIHIKS